MSLPVVENLTNQVVNAQNIVAEKQKAYDDHIAKLKDLERQAEVHRANGSENDLQIVNNQLTSEYAATASFVSALNQAKATLKDREDQLQVAKNSLTSVEKSQLEAQTQIQLNESNAKLAAQKAETEQKSYSQKTTKYLIIGGILIAVVIVVVVWFKRKKSNG